MSIELDHLFICTSAGAPEAHVLKEFGLTEGTPNAHPGQGSACRRFPMRNAFLELLWIENSMEAQSDLVRPTFLWERWSKRANGACPFGICFRPAEQNDGEPSFRTWRYRPPYLPAPLSLAIGSNAHRLTEPLLCYLDFAKRRTADRESRTESLLEESTLSEITRVSLTAPMAAEPRSTEIEAVRATGLVEFRTGEGYLMELGFDGETQGKATDFRPFLPLVCRV